MGPVRAVVAAGHSSSTTTALQIFDISRLHASKKKCCIDNDAGTPRFFYGRRFGVRGKNAMGRKEQVQAAGTQRWSEKRAAAKSGVLQGVLFFSFFFV